MGFEGISNCNDEEIEGVVSFLHLLESHVLIRKGGDRMRWQLMRSGDFTIRSFNETLRGSFPCLSLGKPSIGGRGVGGGVKALWRVSFFV